MKEAVTKKSLAEKIANENGLTGVQAKNIVDNIFDTIVDAVAEGTEVSLHKFGTFQKVERAERQGINPKTMEKLTIPARGALKFKVSKSFKERVA